MSKWNTRLITNMTGTVIPYPAGLRALQVQGLQVDIGSVAGRHGHAEVQVLKQRCTRGKPGRVDSTKAYNRRPLTLVTCCTSTHMPPKSARNVFEGQPAYFKTCQRRYKLNIPDGRNVCASHPITFVTLHSQYRTMYRSDPDNHSSQYRSTIREEITEPANAKRKTLKRPLLCRGLRVRGPKCFFKYRMSW